MTVKMDCHAPSAAKLAGIERPHAPVQRAPNPNRPEKPTPLFKDDE
jgi:hypothetical protein